MQLITHTQHLDAIPASDVKTHITARFDQLSEDTDVPPNIVLVEAADDLTGPDYAFVGNNGLLSDLFEEFNPGETGFLRPLEWASYLPSLQLYETLLLVNNEDGYWIMIPESVVEANPDLKWVIFNSNRSGFPHLYAASVPDDMIKELSTA